MNTTSRIESLDVARALALFGVVVMNFHAYLNGAGSMYPTQPSVWERMFNPLTGPLTTRFAATFVLIAGIGVSLFTQRARASKSHADIQRARIILLRRGTVLYILGYFVQWIWPGTILFYYGAYFILSAIFAMWKSRSIIILAVTTAVTAAAISSWELNRQNLGHSTDWMHPQSIDSVEDLFLRIFIDYTHPVFPWLSFFCIGIVIGRNLEIVRNLLGDCMTHNCDATGV